MILLFRFISQILAWFWSILQLVSVLAEKAYHKHTAICSIFFIYAQLLLELTMSLSMCVVHFSWNYKVSLWAFCWTCAIFESSGMACALGPPWKHGIMLLIPLPTFSLLLIINLKYKLCNYIVLGCCAFCYGWLWNIFGLSHPFFRWHGKKLCSLFLLSKFKIISILSFN